MRAQQKNAPARAVPQVRFTNSLLLPVSLPQSAPFNLHFGPDRDLPPSKTLKVFLGVKHAPASS
jgi:hypothetical protein